MRRGCDRSGCEEGVAGVFVRRWRGRVVVRRECGRGGCEERAWQGGCEERAWHGWLCGEGMTGVVVRRGCSRGWL